MFSGTPCTKQRKIVYIYKKMTLTRKSFILKIKCDFILLHLNTFLESLCVDFGEVYAWILESLCEDFEEFMRGFWRSLCVDFGEFMRGF